MSRRLERTEIEEAAALIEPHTRRTPVLDLGDVTGDGWSLVLKLEHLQVTGSFKPRGAFSYLTRMEVPSVGIAAASGGNFGIAAAYAASQLGHRATVFVPETSPAEKIDKIAVYGAEVRVIAGYYDQALVACESFIEESGALGAHAYDHPLVMAGQGTVGLEVTQEIPDVDSMLVAVGGGGLIGGIASWCQDERRVISVEPVGCRCLHAAREAGHRVDVEVGGVASSSLGAASVGEYPWAANKWIDEALLVEDDRIVEAQRWLWRTARLAVEPAAATPIAALLSGAYTPRIGERVVSVVSGGNVDPGSIH